MPWAEEHKPETRRRIVYAASRAFRRDGYAATGVSAAMAAAGLTHGGFYAHFRSKRDLLSAALDLSFDEAERRVLDGVFADLRGEAWLTAAAERYLSAAHRAAPESGCALPSLAAEVSRLGGEPAAVVASRIEQLVARIADRLEGDDRRARAIGILALMVGGLLLARALPDGPRAEEALLAARAGARVLAR